MRSCHEICRCLLCFPYFCIQRARKGRVTTAYFAGQRSWIRKQRQPCKRQPWKYQSIHDLHTDCMSLKSQWSRWNLLIGHQVVLVCSPTAKHHFVRFLLQMRWSFWLSKIIAASRKRLWRILLGMPISCSLLNHVSALAQCYVFYNVA